jgi:hypothetical protein
MNKRFLQLLFLLTATLSMPLHATPLVSPPKPGDEWMIEALPESSRTRLVDGEAKKPLREPNAKGIPLEKNRQASEFREQAALDSEGNVISLKFLTGEFVIERLGDEKHYAIDTLSHTMPGGRPAWNRLNEFQWVSGKNLRGYSTIDGMECRIHSEEPGESQRKSPRLAAISTADGKPIRLETLNGVFRYIWNQTNPPVMPAPAKEELEKFRLEAKRQIQRHNVPR